MKRHEKEQLVKEYEEILDSNDSIIIVGYSGLSVENLSKFRSITREFQVSFRVIKNRLMGRALSSAGSTGKFQSLKDLLKGPVGIVYSSNPVGMAKIIRDFVANNEKMVVFGGALKDGMILDAAGVQKLALIPSLDELRGKILGIIQAPASRLVALSQAPGAQITRVILAYSEKI